MKTKRYYAFISYAHEDYEDAAYLKNFLEHFKIPQELVGPDLMPEDSKYLRRVFLDKSSLSCKTNQGNPKEADARNVWEAELCEKLANTRFLLVLCSPHSANKKANQDRHYVNFEIEQFLAAHNGNYRLVVPVILNGNPTLDDADTCLPPLLRKQEILNNNLPNFQSAPHLKNRSARKKAREDGCCMVVSRLLNLEREQVKDTLHAEMIHRWKCYGMIAAAVLFVFCALVTWAVYEQKSRTDAEARTHIRRALSILSESEVGQRDTGAAMIHLAEASHLAEARSMLSELLCHSSWLVPVKTEPVTMTEEDKKTLSERLSSEFDLSELSLNNRKITENVPDDFPLIFEYDTRTSDCSVKDKTSKKVLWSLKKQYGLMKCRISPNGLVMILEYSMPDHRIEARDPWSGTLLWTKNIDYFLQSGCFSPDGRRFAFLYPNRMVHVLQTESGKSEFESVRVASDVFKLEFSGDSRNLIASSLTERTHYFLLVQNPYVMLSEDSYVTQESLYDSENRYLWIAYLASGGNTYLQAYHSDSWTKADHFEFPGFVECMSVSSGGDYLFAGIEEAGNGYLMVFKRDASDKILLFQKVKLPFVPYKLLCYGNECFLCGNGLPDSPGKLWKWTSDNPEQCVETAFGDSSGMKDFSIADDGRLIFMGDSVQVYQLGNQKKIASFKTPSSADQCNLYGDIIVISKRLQHGIEAYNLAGKLKWQSEPYGQPGVAPISVDNRKKIVALATGQMQFRIFDLTSGEALSDTIALHSSIESLCFLPSEENTTLIIGMKDGDGADFALWNMASNSLTQFHKTLDSGAKVIRPISQNRFYLGNNPNRRGYVITIPSQKIDANVLDSVRRYTSLHMNRHNITEPVTGKQDGPLPDIPYWKETVRERQETSIAGNNRNSFFNALDFLCLENSDALDQVLDLHPAYLPAIKEYWLSFCRRGSIANYLKKHPETTEEAFRKEWASWKASKWVEFIFKDPQIVYFADFYTKYLLELYPDSTEARQERDTFLRLTGRGVASRQKTIWEEEVLTEKNAAFNKIAKGVKDKINKISSREEILLFWPQLRKMLEESSSWTDYSSDAALSLISIVNLCTTYAIYENGPSMPEINEMITTVTRKTASVSPVSERKALLCKLAQTLAEFYVLNGDQTNAKKQLELIEELSQYDLSAEFLEPILKTLFDIRFANQENAFAEWKKYQEKNPDYAEITSNAVVSDLDILKAKGCLLNQNWSVFCDEIQKNKTEGTQILCSPGGQAEKKGWKSYDTILRFANFAVPDPETFALVLTAQKVNGNADCPVLLFRDNSTIESRISCTEKLGISY